jgi:16S rRNA G966 N2-methylase RsmD
VKELNIINQFRDAVRDYSKAYSNYSEGNVLITTQSSTAVPQIPDNTIDYIFTDPPFGSNIMYSELNFIWESWLNVFTNEKREAIVSQLHGKNLLDYQQLMSNCFLEDCRILKPGRWITIEFHNSKNAVWNSIQEAIQSAGFVVADVRVLDKKRDSFNQVKEASQAIKQDLVISAYKPMGEFRKKFSQDIGSEETVWDFVRQHLEKVPKVVIQDDKIKIVTERQAYLLYDRMVAYHIVQGIAVPIDSTSFFRGLDSRYLKRDDMYFLPNQVNEYDKARIKADVEPIQFSLFVTNEKTAISWLYQQLSEDFDGPQTYAQLQPKFMQEVKSVDQYESMPELAVLLEENFLQDEKGRWYIPDVTKEGDVTKLREKNLWKEFEGYMSSKGKLKLFRSEAVRVGFSRLWKDKNYKAIVDIAERLPEQTIQEDANLLMYYDISLGRIKD